MTVLGQERNLTDRNFHAEAMETVAPIVNLAKKMDYQKRFPRILNATGSYKCYVEEDFLKGIEEILTN